MGIFVFFIPVGHFITHEIDFTTHVKFCLTRFELMQDHNEFTIRQLIKDIELKVTIDKIVARSADLFFGFPRVFSGPGHPVGLAETRFVCSLHFTPTFLLFPPP